MPDAQLPHPQGAVAWLDTMLSTPRQAQQTLAFYQPLLGWSGEPQPQDPHGYAVQQVHGKAVAGVGAMTNEEPTMPWTGYFAVTDIEAAVERIGRAGGTVLCPATEAPGVGRFAHGTDPGGAHFGLWKPDPFPGFETYGEPGCLYWLELVTTAGKASADFYAALFETEVQAMPQMPDSYWTIQVGGEPRAGIFQVEQVEQPHWRPYFQVADVDLAVAAALAAGARQTEAAQDTPFGRMAALVDPNGVEIKVATPPTGAARG
jgi:predicted enzyme related to lactoylglutathione lyase